MVSTFSKVLVAGGLAIVGYLLFFQKAPANDVGTGGDSYGGQLQGYIPQGVTDASAAVSRMVSGAGTIGYPFQYSGQGGNLSLYYAALAREKAAAIKAPTAPAGTTAVGSGSYYGVNVFSGGQMRAPTPTQAAAAGTAYFTSGGYSGTPTRAGVAAALGVPVSFINPSIGASQPASQTSAALINYLRR